jgi:lambda repressor-like predicted transcriptional regulator
MVIMASFLSRGRELRSDPANHNAAAAMARTVNAASRREWAEAEFMVFSMLEARQQVFWASYL